MQSCSAEKLYGFGEDRGNAAVKKMRQIFLGMTAAAIAVCGFAPMAKAELVPYTCWNSYPFRGSIVTVPETCYREIYTPVVNRTPVFLGNAQLDNNANIRTGASFSSRVILNTSRASRVQVHSYSDNGDWAYITTSNGVVGWTNKVNILQD